MRPAARLVRAGVEVIERQEPGHRPQGLGVLQANDAKRAKPASTRSPWPSTSLAPGGRFRTPCNIFSDRVTACEKHLPKARATPHDPHASAQGRKDRLVFDDAQRGLAVRVTGSGGRTYLCQYTLHGEKWRIPLGACSAVSLAKAREGAAVTTGSLTNLGGTAVAVALRAGAPKPDISSVEAFKRALVSAKSVVYADPTKGGASGVYFARVIDRLGLTEQLRGKTVLVPGAQAAEIVARGEAELGIAQTSEIVPVGGAELLGPFPGEIASVTVFTAGISAGTETSEADRALIQFLSGPLAAPTLKAKGFELQ